MYISYKSVLIDTVTGFDNTFNRNKYKDHATFLLQKCSQMKLTRTEFISNYAMMIT